jgi:hypothetical protein
VSPVRKKIQRLLVLFAFGVLALNYPLLALFSKKVLLFSLPLLYIYLFSFWIIFIIFIAFVTERKKMPRTSYPLPFIRKTD